MRTPDEIADDAKEKTSKMVSKQSAGPADAFELEFAAFLAKETPNQHVALERQAKLNPTGDLVYQTSGNSSSKMNEVLKCTLQRYVQMAKIDHMSYYYPLVKDGKWEAEFAWIRSKLAGENRKNFFVICMACGGATQEPVLSRPQQIEHACSLPILCPKCYDQEEDDDEEEFLMCCI